MATKTPIIEIYRSTGGDWCWRLKARNGRIEASGAGYNTKRGARRGVETFKRNAAAAVVVLV